MQGEWTKVRAGKTVQCAKCAAAVADGAPILKIFKPQRFYFCKPCGDEVVAKANGGKAPPAPPTIIDKPGFGRYDTALNMLVEDLSPNGPDMAMLGWMKFQRDRGELAS